MRVLLRLEGHLREFFPKLADGVSFEMAEGASVRELLEAAGVPTELPGSVLCGRQRVELSHTLADRDQVIILSPLAGG